MLILDDNKETTLKVRTVDWSNNNRIAIFYGSVTVGVIATDTGKFTRFSIVSESERTELEAAGVELEGDGTLRIKVS